MAFVKVFNSDRWVNGNHITSVEIEVADHTRQKYYVRVRLINGETFTSGMADYGDAEKLAEDIRVRAS